MSKSDIDSALRRWRDSGLISAELAERLLAEHDSSRQAGRRRFLQYAVSGTAGIILVIAAVTFFAWSWPNLGPGVRTCVIGGAGTGTLLLGMRLETARRFVPVTYALQTTGLILLLAAFMYSTEAWENTTAGGVVVGLLALATPAATIPVFVRRNAVMPAVSAALAYVFLAAFLFRAFDLDADIVIWILDGALVATLAVLGFLLHPGRAESVSRRALYAFAVSLYAGYPMVGMTAVGPLELDDNALLALDAWLLAITALALWGIHRAPGSAAFGTGYVHHLAASVLLAIPLGFGTTLGVYRTCLPWAPPPRSRGPEPAGLWYGLARDARVRGGVLVRNHPLRGLVSGGRRGRTARHGARAGLHRGPLLLGRHPAGDECGNHDGGGAAGAKGDAVADGSRTAGTPATANWRVFRVTTVNPCASAVAAISRSAPLWQMSADSRPHRLATERSTVKDAVAVDPQQGIQPIFQPGGEGANPCT